MLNPMTPAPMMTVFGRNDETAIDAVIADSLRRAYPARFSGSDLSRYGYAQSTARPASTPAFRQCRTKALRMQGFSWAELRCRQRGEELPTTTLEEM